MVQNDGQRDLSARQIAVVTTIATQPKPQTVRGLAKRLNINKPAITRSIDRLEEFALVRRVKDPEDGRSVLAELTADGVTFLRGLSKLGRGAPPVRVDV